MTSAPKLSQSSFCASRRVCGSNRPLVVARPSSLHAARPASMSSIHASDVGVEHRLERQQQDLAGGLEWRPRSCCSISVVTPSAIGHSMMSDAMSKTAPAVESPTPNEQGPLLSSSSTYGNEQPSSTSPSPSLSMPSQCPGAKNDSTSALNSLYALDRLAERVGRRREEGVQLSAQTEEESDHGAPRVGWRAIPLAHEGVVHEPAGSVERQCRPCCRRSRRRWAAAASFGSLS